MNHKNILYHVSSIKNLKTLNPSVSTHKKSYVYATDNMITGLLFGAKKDDFDFILTVNSNGKPELYECYKKAFKDIYFGVACSVYKVNKSGFSNDITPWKIEYINKNKVEVLEEIFIEDLYIKLCDEEDKGNIVIHRFEDTIDYKKIISNHIVDRLIRFEILEQENIDLKLIKHYGKIISILKKLINGEYL